MPKVKKQRRKKTPEEARKCVRGNGDWREPFLAALRMSANVRYACLQAEVSRVIAYDRRKNDPEFAAAWQVAIDDALDMLEATAWKRAQDESDTLLIFLLKSHRRDVYGDQHRHTHAGDPKNPIQHNHQGKVELIGRIEQYTAAFAQLGERCSEAEGDPSGDGPGESLDTGPVQGPALDEAGPIPGP